jgi:hypothetical protein
MLRRRRERRRARGEAAQVKHRVQAWGHSLDVEVVRQASGSRPVYTRLAGVILLPGNGFCDVQEAPTVQR